MHVTDVAVIGAGQAGLAMSRCLSKYGIEHVLFERGEVGARWRSHAWDSLRLLTPNWLNGLPDAPYQGDDPDGFMHHGEFLSYLRSYSANISAPVLAQTSVMSLTHDGQSFRLTTSSGTWRVRALVIATGQCDQLLIPKFSASLNPRVLSIHSAQYRTPLALPAGGVLVVGASASGVQIADELCRAGHEIWLAVGRHTRMPRLWRGRDVFWWMDRIGILAERTRDLPNPEAAMRQPTGQLAGRADRSSIDLATLQALGVRLTGRFVSATGDRITFSGDLAFNVRCAEARLRRLLLRIDAFAGINSEDEPSSIASVDVRSDPPRGLSIRKENIRTIIWATGYRRDFSWLKIPTALRLNGEIAHHDGVTSVPGLYALGFRFLRKRDSHFIGGVGSDAAAIAGQIATFLNRTSRRVA